MNDFEIVEEPADLFESRRYGRWNDVIDEVSKGAVVKIPAELSTNNTRNSIVAQGARRGVRVAVRLYDGCLFVKAKEKNS